MHPALIAFGVAAATLALAKSASASQSGFFYCPVSEGMVAINVGTKSSFKQFPILHNFNTLGSSQAAKTKSLTADLEACDTSTVHCVKEVAINVIDKSGLYVYAIPKVVKIGDVYYAENVRFEVFAAPNIGREVGVVQIVGIPTDSAESKYKMYVAHHVGLVGIAFENPIGIAKSSSSQDGIGEYCEAVGKDRLFNFVVIR